MKSWKDITLKKFLEIRDILSVQDDYTILNLIDCIYGVDSFNMPVSELSKYSIEFLSNDVPHNAKLDKDIYINGRKYRYHFELPNISAAQFVDYQNYSKVDSPEYKDLLSVFVIPEGHTYNDGYDMNIVKDDILDMPIIDVVSAAFFFETQLIVFANLFQHYLKGSISEMKMDKNKKEAIIKIMEVAQLANMGSYLSY